MKADYIHLAVPATHNGNTTSIIRGDLVQPGSPGGRPAVWAPVEFELEPGWVVLTQKDGRRLRLPAGDCQVMESAPALQVFQAASEPFPSQSLGALPTLKASGNKKAK